MWRDVERQQRKTENIYLLQQQIDLTKRLKAEAADNSSNNFTSNG